MESKDSCAGDVGIAERLLYQVMGVADPAHYLHSRYFRAALDAHVPLKPRNILDAGCGAGDYSLYLARRYPEAQVVGVDLDEERIQRNEITARQLNMHNVKFEVADLATADFTSSFDLRKSMNFFNGPVTPPEERLLSLRMTAGPPVG